MDRIKNAANHLINLILATFMSFSFVLALSSTMNLRISAPKVFSFILGLQLIYFIFFFNKLSSRISAAAMGALLVPVFIYIGVNGIFQELLYELSVFGSWLYDFLVYGTTVRNTAYEACVLLILCVSLGLFVHLFGVKKMNFPLLTAAGAALFALQWAYGLFSNYTAFYIFIFLILVYYFKYVFYRNKKNKTNDYVHPYVFTLWALPVCVLTLALAFSMSYKDKPMSWPWLDKRINDIYSYFSKSQGYQSFEYFSIASSGFGNGNGGILGGKVRLDKTLVLKVNSPRPVYLKGASYDVYTGTAWMETDRSKAPFNRSGGSLADYDFAESEKALSLLSNEQNPLDKYFYHDTVTITFANLKTKSLFAPAKTNRINLPVKLPGNVFVSPDGLLTCDRLLGQNLSYSLDAYNVKYTDPDLQKALRNSKTGLYRESLTQRSASRRTRRPADNLVNPNDMNTTVANARSIMSFYHSLQPQELALLSQRADTVTAKYLQLPATLPGRLRELAASITASYQDNYDKVKAIEQYLSQNYPYTLTPKPTPKKRDFVDYFLFDLKQGYCTYYASAMTVLVRSLGIPARYVEGYALPATTKQGNTYEVTNEQAHAWVEVYFEGFGWLPFEPTSPFVSGFYSSHDFSGYYSNDFLMNPDMQDYIRRLQGQSHSNDADIPDITPEKAPVKISKQMIALISAGAFILIILLILLFNLIRKKLLLRKAFKMEPRESVLYLYKYYMKLLKAQKVRINPGETPFQYAARVDTFLLTRPLTFKTVTDIFVRARYSTLELSEKDRKVVCDFYYDLLKKTQRNLGKFKYFVLMYLLGRLHA